MKLKLQPAPTLPRGSVWRPATFALLPGPQRQPQGRELTEPTTQTEAPPRPARLPTPFARDPPLFRGADDRLQLKLSLIHI
eukprot:4038762-Alexandrium_andersonii.AAC.1